MNVLQRFLSMSPEEKKRRGLEWTPAEIAQQPETWRDTAARVAAAAPALSSLLAGAEEVVFAGAGTSDFVGRCVQGPVSVGLRRRALACPTTDIVTHPEYAFPSDRPAVMVSFARSGNSPESVAAVEIVLRERPAVKHLVITCNEDGALTHQARSLGQRAYALVLDPRTNDKGLAMTSSFTSMVMAGLGLGYLERTDEYVSLADRAATAGARVLELAPAIVEQVPMGPGGMARACFLGSGALLGAAVECHLKLQELTAGKVICFYDTFLGLRHGPRAAIHEDTVVVAFLSTDPQVRRYELDLLRSNREQKLGLATVLVADRVGEQDRALADHVVAFDPEGDLRLPDAFLSPVVTIVGQLLGVVASLAAGLRPDAPSAGGVISRVVQGVTIYPWQGKS